MLWVVCLGNTIHAKVRRLNFCEPKPDRARREAEWCAFADSAEKRIRSDREKERPESYSLR